MIRQQVKKSSKAQYQASNIFEKSFNIVKNEQSINWKCSKVLVIKQRINSYPNYDGSKIVEKTWQRNDGIDNLGFDVQEIRSSTLKTSKEGYKRWSAHRERIKGFNNYKTYFCPLTPFRSLKKSNHNTQINYRDLLLHQQMNFSKFQSSNRRNVKKIFLQQIFHQEKHKITDHIPTLTPHTLRVKKEKKYMLAKRKESSPPMIGWEIDKNQYQIQQQTRLS